MAVTERYLSAFGYRKEAPLPPSPGVMPGVEMSPEAIVLRHRLEQELARREQPPRVVVPGPGEVLIDLPYPIAVQFRGGSAVQLRGGLQAVPLSLVEHPVIKRFIVPEAA
jgi:hypothetical protein